MSDARDFDDWARARRSRFDAAVDPCPPGGLVETTYATIKAREGYWPEDFMQLVRTVYRGVVPDRFERRAKAIAVTLEARRRRRAMLDALPSLRWTTLVFLDGSRISTTEFSP